MAGRPEVGDLSIDQAAKLAQEAGLFGDRISDEHADMAAIPRGMWWVKEPTNENIIALARIAYAAGIAAERDRVRDAAPASVAESLDAIEAAISQ